LVLTAVRKGQFSGRSRLIVGLLCAAGITAGILVLTLSGPASGRAARQSARATGGGTSASL